MEVRKDILKQDPEVGDIIVFNPPQYKGLVYGICIGFTNLGLPKVGHLSSMEGMSYTVEKCGFYTPKTGFVVVK